jgi:hypothetical protein
LSAALAPAVQDGLRPETTQWRMAGPRAGATSGSYMMSVYVLDASPEKYTAGWLAVTTNAHTHIQSFTSAV